MRDRKRERNKLTSLCKMITVIKKHTDPLICESMMVITSDVCVESA